MHRFFLYPFFVLRFAMKCFTASGSDRLVCWLMYVSALSVNLIVLSALALFFICISTFKIGAVFGKMRLACWS